MLTGLASPKSSAQLALETIFNHGAPTKSQARPKKLTSLKVPAEIPTFALFIDQSTPQKCAPVVVPAAEVVDDDMLWSLPHKLTGVPSKSPFNPPLNLSRPQNFSLVQTKAPTKVHSKTQTNKITRVNIDTQTPIIKWAEAETQTHRRIAVDSHTQTSKPSQTNFLAQVSPLVFSVPTQTDPLPQPPPQVNVSTQNGDRLKTNQAVQTTYLDYKHQFLEQKRRADELERRLEKEKSNPQFNPPMAVPMWAHSLTQPMAQSMAQPMALPSMMFPPYYSPWAAPHPQFLDLTTRWHRKRRSSTCSSCVSESPPRSRQRHRHQKHQSPPTPPIHHASPPHQNPPTPLAPPAPSTVIPAPVENTTYYQDYYTPYPLDEFDGDPQLPLSPLEPLQVETTLASPPRRKPLYPRDEFLLV